MTATRTLYALVVASCFLALLMATRPSLLTGLPDGPRAAAGPASPPSDQTLFLAARIRAKAEIIRAPSFRRDLTFTEAVEAFHQVNATQDYAKKGWRLVEAPLDLKDLRTQVIRSARDFAGEVDGAAAVLEDLEREWVAAGGDAATP